MTESASIGIIGGADGPTAVVVSGSIWSLILPAVILIVVVIAVVLLIRHFIKKRKK